MGDLLALDGKYLLAQSCFERALAQSFPQAGMWQSQLQRKISDVLIPQYRHDLAFAALDRAEEVLQVSLTAGTTAELQEWLEIQLSRIQLYYWDNQPGQMEALIREIEPVIESVGLFRQKITLLSLRYQARIRFERYRLSAETVEIVRRRLEQVDKIGDLNDQAWARFQYGFGLLWHGDPSTARPWLASAHEAFERMGSRLMQLRCLAYLSVVSRKLNDPLSLQKELPPLLELSRAMDEYAYLGIGLANQGWQAWQLGDSARAVQSCQEARGIWAKFNGSTFHALADWVLLAEASSRDDLSAAVGHARALLDPDPAFQPVEEPMSGWLNQALTASASGSRAAALDFFDRALQAAKAAREL
jgi:tetratricopeptide (TPR) repeat protein